MVCSKTYNPIYLPRTSEDLSPYIWNVCEFLETNYCMPTRWLTGPLQKSFPRWLKPLVTPLTVGSGTFRLAAGRHFPMSGPSPRGEPIAVWIAFWRHFENIFSMIYNIEKRISSPHPWVFKWPTSQWRN